MRFDRHAFISYAHIDNQPLTPEQEGWVSRFHATLAIMLSQRLGQHADIWRDDKLAGNDVFAREIIDQFARTALLIPVLTPRYLKSEWCNRELEAFCAATERSGGLLVDNKCRVFKVIKTPLADESPLPPPLAQMLGYEFFDLDEDQTPRDLDPAFGEASRQAFLRKLNKLAWDIAQLWSRLEQLGEAPPEGAGTGQGQADATPGTIDRPAVFLAEVSRDQRNAREMVETALKRHGYRVLPERQLPLDEDALIRAVDACLEQCAFSIHLIGSGPGVVPDGPGQRSIVVLQNELATGHSRRRALPRLIWLPAGTTGEQPAQQAFIDALQSDAGAQFGADLLTGDLESVKSTIVAALLRIEQAASAPSPPSSAAGNRTVHLLCDERDRAAVVPLVRELRAAGLQVSLPVFAGDAAAVREANQQRLAGCDVILLFYGAADEAWKFHQENEVRRMAALRASRRAPPVQLCLGPPSTPDKALLVALDDAGLVDATSGLSEALISAVVARLHAGPSIDTPPAP